MPGIRRSQALPHYPRTRAHLRLIAHTTACMWLREHGRARATGRMCLHGCVHAVCARRLEPQLSAASRVQAHPRVPARCAATYHFQQLLLCRLVCDAPQGVGSSVPPAAHAGVAAGSAGTASSQRRGSGVHGVRRFIPRERDARPATSLYGRRIEDGAGSGRPVVHGVLQSQ